MTTEKHDNGERNLKTVSVAAGRVDITPTVPSVLGGFRDRYKPFEGIGDKLEANVLLLTAQATKLVLVTVDALYPGRLLRSRLLDMLGLAETELFLAASHTHYAPMTSPDMPALGVHDEDYIKSTADRIVALVRSLEVAGPKPVAHIIAAKPHIP